MNLMEVLEVNVNVNGNWIIASRYKYYSAVKIQCKDNKSKIIMLDSNNKIIGEVFNVTKIKNINGIWKVYLE